MTQTALLVLFLSLGGTVYSACPPNSCDGVTCQTNLRCGSGQRYDAQGGVCGCCAACIEDIRIALGESCQRMPGQYSTPLCVDGLRCHPSTFTCVVNEQQQQQQNTVAGLGEYCGPSFFRGAISCAQDLQCMGGQCVQQSLAYQFNQVASCRQMAVQTFKNWLTRANGNWFLFIQWLQMVEMAPSDLPPVPRCKDDGTYSPVQCLREGGANRCYCASSVGTILRQFPADPRTSSCLCAQAQADYFATGMVGQSFSCETDGSYRSVQCIGSVCYCSDSLGNKLTKYSAPISNIQALGCVCARDEFNAGNSFTATCDQYGNYPNSNQG